METMQILIEQHNEGLICHKEFLFAMQQQLDMLHADCEYQRHNDRFCKDCRFAK